MAPELQLFACKSDSERSTRTSFTHMNNPYWNKYRYSCHCECSLMPGFHHSFAVVPLPCRCAVPFFRSVATVAVAGENGNAGNVFPYT